MNMKRTNGEKVFAVFNTIFLCALVIATLYPVLYVLFASLSNPIDFYKSGKFLLKPAGFSIESYKIVFKNSLIWTGYLNTIFYAAVGTFCSVLCTVLAAYCLSRRNLPGKNAIVMAMMFTMYFGGGMIPHFLVIRSLGLLDNRAVMILPGLVSTYNFIIVLTYFKGLPYELEEAATIDGANEWTVLFKILLPLSKPVVSVIALYYLVGIWNNFMTALLYLTDTSKYPLQLVLREILFQGAANSQTMAQVDDASASAETMKYAVMVVSTVPVLCVYPFIQRYFVKGVMIGAVKG